MRSHCIVAVISIVLSAGGAIASEAPSQGEATPVVLDAAPTGYRIGAEDILDIRVYGEPDLNAVARVSSEGTVVLPLIGQLAASGLTTEELTAKITATLKDGYLKSPQVMVLLQQYRQAMVHIMGEVSAPGPYRLTHHNTLMELISKAGGFTPVAKRSQVRIIRQGQQGENIIIVDTTKIIDEGRLDEDLSLSPGDIIVVPERFF